MILHLAQRLLAAGLGQRLLAAGFWLASVALGAVVLAYAACWAIGQLLLAAARVR